MNGRHGISDDGAVDPVRATVPQLNRYTCRPGRSLHYHTSLRYRDQRGYKAD